MSVRAGRSARLFSSSTGPPHNTASRPRPRSTSQGRPRVTDPRARTVLDRTSAGDSGAPGRASKLSSRFLPTASTPRAVGRPAARPLPGGGCPRVRALDLDCLPHQLPQTTRGAMRASHPRACLGLWTSEAFTRGHGAVAASVWGPAGADRAGGSSAATTPTSSCSARRSHEDGLPGQSASRSTQRTARSSGSRSIE